MSPTDSYGKHEVVHTASIIVDMISDHILDHGAVEVNPKWKALADAAFEAAWKLYQTVAADTMGDSTHRLKEIIKEKSFRKGEFTLASGKTSNYFFDLKPTMMNPEGINLIADVVLDKLKDLDNVVVAAIGGMATGAIPIVAVVSAKTFEQGELLPAFFVRKVAKDHGTENQIEGELTPGAVVVLVEDVTTTGGSVFEAVKAVRAIGCEVAHVITVIDRLEGARDYLKEEDIELHSIFVRTDFDDD